MTSLNSLAPFRRLGAAVSRLPESKLFHQPARSLTGERLRVLAFHGVPDLVQFERMVSEIRQRYTPVSADDVANALERGGALPRYPVWFTFDDGLPSTFKAGAMLAQHGVRATAFVCPAVLESPRLLWFQVVEACASNGLLSGEEREAYSLSRLKLMSDIDRRAVIDGLSERLGASSVTLEHATVGKVRHWVEQGHDVGNHTWDHPMLDQCTPAQQRTQVASAHDWFEKNGFDVRFFAFPNGNWASDAAAQARDVGYVGSLLFDHRLTDLRVDPHMLSRLRIDSDAEVPRALGILSGLHSGLFHAPQQLARAKPRRLKAVGGPR